MRVVGVWTVVVSTVVVGPWLNHNGGLLFVTAQPLNMDDAVMTNHRLEKANLSKTDLPPFFLIPPLCGTRLRAWSTMECTGALRISPGDDIWVNAPLISTQPRCWVECARLWGPEMKDSPSCASRADEGLDAISTLASGFLGMFSHSMIDVIHALAELGYDPTRLWAAPYDFRLTPEKLEQRDGYFSRLKASIELERRRTDLRVVVLAHSLGCRIFAYFLDWLKADVGAIHQRRWIDQNVAIYFANGGPILGSPDVATSLVVGAQQGMPIALKLIHEVLASSGGLLTLAQAPGKTTFDDEMIPWLRADWNSFEDEDVDDDESIPTGDLIEEFGPEPCRGNKSALAFFRKGAKVLNDSHFADLAHFLERCCRDTYVGDLYKVGVERPPIDVVHVAYGVGLETRLQTTFALSKVKNTFQTEPYFADRLPESVLDRSYRRPTRTWTVNGTVSEVGARRRIVHDDKRRLLKPELPGRSGDDTVPYASLSAAHEWLGEDVTVVTVPLRKKFLHEEVKEGTYDRKNRAPSSDRETAAVETADDGISLDEKVEDDEEPRLTVFESAETDERGFATRTTIWEMEGASHRTSANHPVYLEHLQRLLLDHAATVKRAKLTAPRGAEDLLASDVSGVSLSTKLFQAADFVPTDDSECFWSFLNAQCAYPAICEYRYHVGDLYLSQSCRLKKHNTGGHKHSSKNSHAHDL